MLVVVTIIALFAAVVGTTMFKKTDQARVTAAKLQISNFMDALGQYKLDTGVFPTTEQGLNALRVKPEGVNNWNGPYLPKDVPLDQWGHAFVSYGADGQPGGDGINADILSWKN
jgi:general secretion pathway protein G